MSGRPGAGEGAGRVRLDVWLWRARFFKTRAIAAAHLQAGAVRLSRAGLVRAQLKPGDDVRPGDALTIMQAGQARSIIVRGLGERRGPAAEARALYQEHAPALDAAPGSRHLPPTDET